MSFRKLLGLAAIGGLIYAHRKHGGQMTLDSFKRSGRDLVEGVRNRAKDIRAQAEARIRDIEQEPRDIGSSTTGFTSDAGETLR